MIRRFRRWRWITCVPVLSAAPLGVWLGLRLHRMVSQALFYRLSYAMLVVAGAKLLWDGISGSL